MPLFYLRVLFVLTRSCQGRSALSAFAISRPSMQMRRFRVSTTSNVHSNTTKGQQTSCFVHARTRCREEGVADLCCLPIVHFECAVVTGGEGGAQPFRALCNDRFTSGCPANIHSGNTPQRVRYHPSPARSQHAHAHGHGYTLRNNRNLESSSMHSSLWRRMVVQLLHRFRKV